MEGGRGERILQRGEKLTDIVMDDSHGMKIIKAFESFGDNEGKLRLDEGFEGGLHDVFD